MKFTINLNYLLNNPNTYRDVAHLHQIEDSQIAKIIELRNKIFNDNSSVKGPITRRIRKRMYK